MMNRRLWLALSLVCSLPLSLTGGCVARGDATRPIPLQRVNAPRPARRTVVFLPGRGDDLRGLQRCRVAQRIQQVWPDADVILTGLTMPYYTSGTASRRLHDEVIAPLRRQGGRPIWLVGISLGGMGALQYDGEYPAAADGIVLLSPYLGEAAILREIRAAGGLATWQPGPPQALGPDTFQRELWRYLKRWPHDPARTSTVWLAYGAQERFRPAIEQMSPMLPAGHVRMLPGRHDWTLWTKALPQMLQAADDDTAGVRDPDR